MYESLHMLSSMMSRRDSRQGHSVYHVSAYPARRGSVEFNSQWKRKGLLSSSRTDTVLLLMVDANVNADSSELLRKPWIPPIRAVLHRVSEITNQRGYREASKTDREPAERVRNVAA